MSDTRLDGFRECGKLFHNSFKWFRKFEANDDSAVMYFRDHAGQWFAKVEATGKTYRIPPIKWNHYNELLRMLEEFKREAREIEVMK